MPQNYVVTVGSVGPYPNGSVIPGYAVPDVAQKVAAGALAPTDAPVNVTLVAPRPVAEDDTDLAAELADTRNRLTAAVERAAFAEGQAAESARRADALKGELADYVAETDRLRTELAQARADLEAANKLVAEAADVAAA